MLQHQRPLDNTSPLGPGGQHPPGHGHNTPPPGKGEQHAAPPRDMVTTLPPDQVDNTPLSHRTRWTTPLLPPPGPGGQHYPPPTAVNGRAVRILLECILVSDMTSNVFCASRHRFVENSLLLLTRQHIHRFGLTMTLEAIVVASP